jgi:hypothetical protein
MKLSINQEVRPVETLQLQRLYNDKSRVLVSNPHNA